MFSADALTFREFMTGEPLPLASIHNAVLEFLRGRDDVVIFGAHAVNAYVNEPRMTQAVDLLSTRADEVAQELCDSLRERLHIAVRIRKSSDGRSFRIFQVREEGNRHWVYLRHVESLPKTKRIAGVLVIAPAALIALKVIAYRQRRGQPKSGTDWRDVATLLLTFPHLKSNSAPVVEQLHAAGASPEVLATWQELVAQVIRPAKDEEGY